MLNFIFYIIIFLYTKLLFNEIVKLTLLKVDNIRRNKERRFLYFNTIFIFRQHCV